MIRLRCSGCNKMLSVADTHAGKLGACPQCKSKIRIPALDDVATDFIEDDSETPPPSRSERVRSSPSSKPRRREEHEEAEAEEDLEPAEESPPRRGRRGADEERERRPSRGRRAPDEEDEDEDEPPRRRRSGKRRRKAGASSGSTSLLVSGLILGGICLVTGLLAIFVPALSILPVGLGFLIMAIGGIWFLIVAFQDDALQGVLCWFVPFYSLYYLITHFEEEKKPFFVQMGGLVLIMVGSCAGGLGEGLSR